MVIVTVIIGPFVSGFSKYNKIRKLNIWHKHWGKKRQNRLIMLLLMTAYIDKLQRLERKATNF